jgi:curved DNA-binding protein CbpA
MATATAHPASGNAKKKTRPRPPTHYEVLQVPPVADVATIKAAYKKAALLHHPDKRRRAPQPSQAPLASTNDDKDVTANNNDDDDDDSQFQRIQVAWECLRHVEQRQVYDEELWLLSKQQSSRQASSIPLERSDCREEYLESVGDYTLIYTCRCGQDVDTAEVDADSDDDDGDDVLSADKDLVTCPGCCFVYDTSPLWRDNEEEVG